MALNKTKYARNLVNDSKSVKKTLKHFLIISFTAAV